MKRLLKIGGGTLCLGFGGFLCLALFAIRVDPPQVGRVNTMIAIAAGIVALGVNLIGKAIVAGSANDEKKKVIVFVLSFATWLGISIGLVTWHQVILHIRKTRATGNIEQEWREQEGAGYLPPATESAEPTQ
ncbi:MAG: hypothetical protein GX811_11510 [Lentisphaerae bacterium]|jgi:hypothetical protein|nr:hypothetical protein [Lentisphaerota bacterium]